MNWFFNMPIEFQIGSIVAFVFLALSLLLLWCKWGFAMITTWLISFLSCLVFCRLPMIDFWVHFFLTAIVYELLRIFMVKQFHRALLKKQLEKLYSSDYESITANPLEFTWLDLDYYDTKQRELESLGFQKVDDFEFLPLTNTFPKIRTFSRRFINAEQDIEVSITHIRMIKPENTSESSIDHRIVRFFSEFSDGTFIETSNARGNRTIGGIGDFEVLMSEPTVSIEKLLDAHEERIETICETKKVDVVIHRNTHEMSAAAERRFLLLCKDRKEKCGLTESERDRIISSSNLNSDDAGVKTYFSEYNKQARKRRKKQEDEFPQS